MKISNQNLLRSLALASVVLFSTVGCSKSFLPGLKPAFLGKSSVEDLSSQLRTEAGFKEADEWFESYELAHRESLRTGKPIMAAFTGSDWCGPCIQLKKKVFETPQFKSWAAQNVVLVELDFPKGKSLSPSISEQNQNLAQKYNITGYPTVLMIDDSGAVLGKLGHDTNADRWIKRASSQLGS